MIHSRDFLTEPFEKPFLPLHPSVGASESRILMGLIHPYGGGSGMRGGGKAGGELSVFPGHSGSPNHPTRQRNGEQIEITASKK